MNPDFIGFFVGQIHQYSRIVPLGPAPVTTAKRQRNSKVRTGGGPLKPAGPAQAPLICDKGNNPAVAPLMVIAAAAL
jgi:hypothetical protein